MQNSSVNIVCMKDVKKTKRYMYCHHHSQCYPAVLAVSSRRHVVPDWHPVSDLQSVLVVSSLAPLSHPVYLSGLSPPPRFSGFIAQRLNDKWLADELDRKLEIIPKQVNSNLCFVCNGFVSLQFNVLGLQLLVHLLHSLVLLRYLCQHTSNVTRDRTNK